MLLSPSFILRCCLSWPLSATLVSCPGLPPYCQHTTTFWVPSIFLHFTSGIVFWGPPSFSPPSLCPPAVPNRPIGDIGVTRTTLMSVSPPSTLHKPSLPELPTLTSSWLFSTLACISLGIAKSVRWKWGEKVFAQQPSPPRYTATAFPLCLDWKHGGHPQRPSFPNTHLIHPQVVLFPTSKWIRIHLHDHQHLGCCCGFAGLPAAAFSPPSWYSTWRPVPRSGHVGPLPRALQWHSRQRRGRSTTSTEAAVATWPSEPVEPHSPSRRRCCLVKKSWHFSTLLLRKSKRFLSRTTSVLRRGKSKCGERSHVPRLMVVGRDFFPLVILKGRPRFCFWIRWS